jgi:NADH-quinone oxidoreductase subunit J
MTADWILFIGLGVVAVGSALGMLFSRNSIYSALFLIMNFGVVALFYLILSAPFIALTQVTVYAGAIMVLFLFVIMLLGAEQAGHGVKRWWLQPAALILGALLAIETVFVLVFQVGPLKGGGAEIPADFGGPGAVGSLLFRDYLLPFEVVSVLLLVAMVGAIVLTRKRPRQERRIQRPAQPGDQA